MVDCELISSSGDHSIVSHIVEVLLSGVTVWLGKDKSVEAIRSIKDHIGVGFVMEGSISDVPVPMLIKVIKDFMFNGGNELSIILSGGKYPVEGGVLIQLRVEIEASIRLHGGGVWLS